jgi:hypothetical protein
VKDQREEGFLIKGGCWEGVSCHRQGTFESLLLLLLEVLSKFCFFLSD